MAAVFVVEDVALVMVLAESILQEAGHETLTAGTLPQAMAVLDGDRQFDVLITDINLMDEAEGGLKLAQEVVSRRPGTKVLYATGLNITDGMREMMVNDAPVLAKPYTAPALTEAVNKLLGERQNT